MFNNIEMLKQSGLTYIDSFGENLNGYIYVGNKINNKTPLIIYEEGRSMPVHLNGLGYLINSGNDSFNDCIIYLHKRKYSIEPNDVSKVTKLLKDKFKGLFNRTLGIGFSNGAQSIVEAAENDHNLFDSILAAGASPSNNFMKNHDENKKTVLLLNNIGEIKNFDKVGSRMPAKGIEAYSAYVVHNKLDLCLSNAKFVRKFIENDTKFSSSEKNFVYPNVYKLDSIWLNGERCDINKCKYKNKK